MRWEKKRVFGLGKKSFTHFTVVLLTLEQLLFTLPFESATIALHHVPIPAMFTVRCAKREEISSTHKHTQIPPNIMFILYGRTTAPQYSIPTMERHQIQLKDLPQAIDWSNKSHMRKVTHTIKINRRILAVYLPCAHVLFWPNKSNSICVPLCKTVWVCAHVARLLLT